MPRECSLFIFFMLSITLNKANGHSRLGLPNDLIDSNSHTLDHWTPWSSRRWVERGLLGLLGYSEINSYPTIFCNFEGY